MWQMSITANCSPYTTDQELILHPSDSDLFKDQQTFKAHSCGLSKPYFQTHSAFSLQQLQRRQSLAYQKLHSNIYSSAFNDSPTCLRSSLPSNSWKHCNVDLPYIIHPASNVSEWTVTRLKNNLRTRPLIYSSLRPSTQIETKHYYTTAPGKKCLQCNYNLSHISSLSVSYIVKKKRFPRIDWWRPLQNTISTGDIIKANSRQTTCLKLIQHWHYSSMTCLGDTKIDNSPTNSPETSTKVQTIHCS